jgi:hypothetical protein
MVTAGTGRADVGRVLSSLRRRLCCCRRRDLGARPHAAGGAIHRAATGDARRDPLHSSSRAAGRITNNWVAEDGGTRVLRPLFDVFIESAVVGIRKPDPRIFHLACGALDVAPHEAIFLDDIGLNLKAARALGMTTIKVEDVDSALSTLSDALGFPLR